MGESWRKEPRSQISGFLCLCHYVCMRFFVCLYQCWGCLFACVFLNCSVWALRVTVQLPYQKRNYAPAYGQQLSHRVLVNILHRNKVVVIVCYNGITQLITECMSCDIKPNLGINKYRNFPLCKQKRNCCSCFVLVWFLSQLVGLGQSTKNTGWPVVLMSTSHNGGMCGRSETC
jgi:hypothetical protein